MNDAFFLFLTRNDLKDDNWLHLININKHKSTCRPILNTTVSSSPRRPSIPVYKKYVAANVSNAVRNKKS